MKNEKNVFCPKLPNQNRHSFYKNYAKHTLLQKIHDGVYMNNWNIIDRNTGTPEGFIARDTKDFKN